MLRFNISEYTIKEKIIYRGKKELYVLPKLIINSLRFQFDSMTERTNIRKKVLTSSNSINNTYCHTLILNDDNMTKNSDDILSAVKQNELL